VFVVLLFGLLQYFKHADITSLTQFSPADFGRSFFDFSAGNGLSAYGFIFAALLIIVG
jgi:Ca2+-transporting ATPase